MDEQRMSDLNPYEQLKVAEDASFEDIQSARDQLLKVHQDDEQTRERVEVAYDSILMDRLRKRQEGKIKVPEGIRFAEQLAEKPAKASPPPVKASLPWVQELVDVPDTQVVGVMGAVYAGLAILGVLSMQGKQSDTNTLSLLITIGFGVCVYWINRKENKLGRAFLGGLAAMVLGGIIGMAFWQGFHNSGLITQPAADNSVVAVVVFIMFWLASSFLR